MLKFILIAGLMITGATAYAAVETTDDSQTEAGLEDELATLPTPGLESIDTTNSALEAELDQAVAEELKQFSNELETAATEPAPAAAAVTKSKKSKSAKAGKSGPAINK